MNAAPFASGPRVETTDHIGIATYDLGGEGPPLILAHATGFHGRVWLPVAAALGARYHCWSFDSRGHGDSDPAPDDDYDWQGLARDVQAVVDGLGIRQPRAVGHSAGGAALLLAEEAQPGSFAALYCYEPVVPIIAAGGREAPVDTSLAAGARRRREVFASRQAALTNYAAKTPFTTFDPAALAAYVEWGFHDLADGTVQLTCRGEAEARVYEQAWRHHAYQHLDQVACPVTIASGGIHAHFALEAITAVSSRIRRGAPIDQHEDLGHFGPMERPAEVAASIIAAFDTMADS